MFYLVYYLSHNATDNSGDCICGRHDLAELLIRLKQYEKAEKLLKHFIDSEQKGMS